MLYHLYEMQRIAWAPVELAARTTRLYGDMLKALGGGEFARPLEAVSDLVERSTRRHRLTGFDIDHVAVGRRRVPVREEVVTIRPFCTLRRFVREDAPADPRRVLLAAPMSGHFAALLRETVLALVADFEVFVTDWADARQVPLAAGSFDLDENIAYLLRFLRDLGPATSVVAVSQSTVPALAATALIAAEEPAASPPALVLIAGPIDIGANPTPANEAVLARSADWYERTVVATVPWPHPGFLRRVLPGFVLLSAYTSLHLDRHVDAHYRYFLHLVRGDGEKADAHRRFYDRFLSVMDLPAELYLQSLETVFRETALARGTMAWRGVPVRPAAIRGTALMTVEGGHDDVSAPGQTAAAHRITPAIPDARRAHHLEAGVGHFGVFHGRRWQRSIYPRVRDFIRRHGDSTARSG